MGDVIDSAAPNALSIQSRLKSSSVHILLDRGMASALIEFRLLAANSRWRAVKKIAAEGPFLGRRDPSETYDFSISRTHGYPKS